MCQNPSLSKHMCHALIDWMKFPFPMTCILEKISIHYHDRNLNTIVSRQPTHTDRLLDESSYNPTSHKATTTKTLTRRVQLVCDTPDTLRLTPYYKPTTTLRHLLTNVKDRDEPKDRHRVVYKIKCSDCQDSYIGETGRNLNTRTSHEKW